MWEAAGYEMFSDSVFSSIFPEFFSPTCLHTVNCRCCNKTCFWVASSLPSNITLTTGNWFLWRRHFQKWDFSFLKAYSLEGTNNWLTNGPPNSAFWLSTAEGGCKFERLALSFMFWVKGEWRKSLTFWEISLLVFSVRGLIPVSYSS